MDIKYDFSGFWALIARLNAPKKSLKLEKYSPNIPTFPPLIVTKPIEFGKQGIEVNQNGTFSYKNEQVVIYIYDHSFNYDAVVNDFKEGNKFHIFNCSTIVQMKKKNRYTRYVATNIRTGIFPIGGMLNEKPVESEKKLFVCMNCLKELNYENAATNYMAKEIRNTFDLQTFFDKYSTRFSSTKTAIYEVGYTNDWPVISRQFKEKANWTCEKCSVNLTNHKELLHGHHINGVKSDNDWKNIKILCADCHRREPNHEHMLRLSLKDSYTILRERVQQKLVKRNWESVFQNCDFADLDILKLIQKKYVTAPLIDYAINDNKKLIIDYAWPEQKFGIITSRTIEHTENKDNWNIYHYNDYIQNNL